MKGILVFGNVAQGRAYRGQQHRAKETGTERFDGDRYEFQILIEALESASGHGTRLKDLITNAITLVDCDTLRELKQEVLSDA